MAIGLTARALRVGPAGAIEEARSENPPRLQDDVHGREAGRSMEQIAASRELNNLFDERTLRRS